MRRSVCWSLTALLALGTACRNEQEALAAAAAKMASTVRMLGPNDLQILSLDRTVGLEVVGDSVFVFMENSRIAVPATALENVRYADGRLRFDIQGFGMKVFDVGDGTEGAAFRVTDAIAFVAQVLQRQNEIEARSGAAR